MKNLKYIIGLLLLTATVNAQNGFVKPLVPPIWASSAPKTVQYYYLPDIHTYYDASGRQYITNNNGTWVRTAELPARYRGYNLRTSHPVYLTDYRGNTPYVLYKEHKVKYKANGWKSNGHDNGLHKGQHKGKKKK